MNQLQLQHMSWGTHILHTLAEMWPLLIWGPILCMWQVRGTVQCKATTSSPLSNQQVPFVFFMAQKLHCIAAVLQEIWTVIRNKGVS